jgi:TPR repeat protein
MANQPPKEEEIAPPEPSYPPDAPVLEQARTALREGISPDEAVDFAGSLPESPERADAVFLLLEYAADEGNKEAALAVGRFYDPTHEGPSGSILKNPSTAYDWYREALSGGQAQAAEDLARLHDWVEEQSTQGSRSAKELLGRWGSEGTFD